MFDDQTAGNPPHVSIEDARGVVIGGDNRIYQYFLNQDYRPLAQKLITFTALIEERTTSFVGRDFVFEAIDKFREENRSGYFVIKGEAGIGKTALIAHLAKTRGYVHHFVVAPLGINRPDQCLENLCAQLITKFKLDHREFLLRDAGRDGAVLNELLLEVSRRLDAGEQAVLLVDALDEVDWRHGTRENLLFLPSTLPAGVFIVVTTRYKAHLPLTVDFRQEYYLDPNAPDNLADVMEYIRQNANREGMYARLSEWGQDVESFVEVLRSKSEGNFMYLRHVLPAIEAGKFRDGTADELPQGLRDYYERHWLQIREIDEDKWVEYRQPVICFLAEAREPVTIWQIASWAKLKPARVLSAVRDWREFLDEEPIEGVMRYRIYHQSFQDFLAAKDEVRNSGGWEAVDNEPPVQ